MTASQAVTWFSNRTYAYILLSRPTPKPKESKGRRTRTEAHGALRTHNHHPGVLRLAHYYIYPPESKELTHQAVTDYVV